MGGFAGGFTGTLLNGGDLGQALKAGIIGGVIGGVAAGLSNSVGTLLKNDGVIAKMLAHGITQGGVESASGGNFFHGFMAAAFTAGLAPGIQRAFSGSQFEQVIASMVVGGTGSVLGGGKFANGAITGAYVMMFNEFMHGGDDDNVSETRKIRSAVGNSKNVQAVENSIMNDDGAVNIVLQAADNLKVKSAGVILKVIDVWKFIVDVVAPWTNYSLDQEYNRKFNVPKVYKPHGVRMGKNGKLENY